jgi:ubiquinone/menaquinone biosynthesis C-methylase UbiE
LGRIKEIAIYIKLQYPEGWKNMEIDFKKWLNREGEVFLENIGIKKGDIVLDFGCGDGPYTIPAAKVVRKEGKVYAMDKDIESMHKLMEVAKTKGLKNIIPLHTKSKESKINLEAESIDVVLLYDVLHYMEALERKRIYEEIYRILKTGGFLSVYPKHCKSDEPLGNLSDMELDDVIQEINSSHFYLQEKFYKKLLHNSNYNMGYILNFRKK